MLSCKKIISIMAVMLLVFCNTFAYAESNEPNKEVTKVTINEYLMLKELKNKPNLELQKMGFSSQEIEKIRKFDYAEELYNRSKLDDSTLKNLGYTDEQIKMLRNFSGTEEEIIALAATLSINASTVDYYYVEESNRTYYRGRFDWEWSSAPVVLIKDIIGIAWSEGMYLETSPSLTYHTVRYVSTLTGNTTYVRFNIDPIAPVGGAETKFKMWRSGADYAKSGTGFILVHKLGRIPEVALYVEYGHKTIGLGEPSVSLTGELTLSFSYDVQKVDYDLVVEQLSSWE